MWEGAFGWLSAGAAAVAAALWLRASIVPVDPGWRPGVGRSEPPDPTAANVDLILALMTATATSGRLNAWAARAAAVAALLQAASLVAHQLGW